MQEAFQQIVGWEPLGGGRASPGVARASLAHQFAEPTGGSGDASARLVGGGQIVEAVVEKRSVTTLALAVTPRPPTASYMAGLSTRWGRGETRRSFSFTLSASSGKSAIVVHTEWPMNGKSFKEFHGIDPKCDYVTQLERNLNNAKSGNWICNSKVTLKARKPLGGRHLGASLSHFIVG